MTINCDIIKDLLPLYKDDAASEASKAVITAHLKRCPECRRYYKMLDISLGDFTDFEAGIPAAYNYKDLSRKIRRSRSLLFGSAAAIAALSVGVSLFVMLSDNLTRSRNIQGILK